jgi:hypothetical protein
MCVMWPHSYNLYSGGYTTVVIIAVIPVMLEIKSDYKIHNIKTDNLNVYFHE